MLTKVIDFIDDLIPYWFFRAIKRSAAYAIQGWSSYDFDHAYIDRDMLFKLKRVQAQLLNDASFVDYDKEVLKSLKVAIKVLYKIIKGDFRTHSNAVDQKWGEIEMDFNERDSETGYTRLILKRANVNSEEDEVLCRAESSEAYLKDDLHLEKYRKLFYRILVKYQSKWWS